MLQGRLGLTVARNARGSGIMEQARLQAHRLDAVFLERPHNRTLEELMAEHGLAAIIVWEQSGPRIYSGGGEFAYHAGMAVLRLRRLLRGESDHLLTALAVQPGARVLDCTLGLGGDAAVASWAAGAAGMVVGLEASPLLHFVVSYGLAHYVAKEPLLNEALRRIRTVNIKAEDYLAQCAPDSFDAVYFDPMFRRPVRGAQAMAALRPLAWEEPLPLQAVELALRAAPRVVIKERSEELLRQYGCREFVGGRYSRVKFGIIRRQR